MTLSSVMRMDACIFNVELAKYIREQIILLFITNFKTPNLYLLLAIDSVLYVVISWVYDNLYCVVFLKLGFVEFALFVM